MSKGRDLHFPESRKSRRSFWRWAWRIVVWLLVAILAYQVYLFASVVWYRWFNPEQTAFMADERARLGSLDPPRNIVHTWVAYDQISRYAKRAVVASEDSGFAEHGGIEWEAIEQAARTNLESGKIRRGGSTITMQVAKKPIPVFGPKLYSQSARAGHCPDDRDVVGQAAHSGGLLECRRVGHRRIWH